MQNHKVIKSFRKEIEKIVSINTDLPWLTFYSDYSDNKSYTLKQLGSRVCDFCHFYSTIGLKKEDSIVIILHESLDLFASFFAGIIYGALPGFYAYPSKKQSNSNFIDSLKGLLTYNKITN